MLRAMSGSAFRLLALFMLASLLGCTAKPKPVLLQREWTANAEFAGDVWAAAVAGNQGIRLEVREGSDLIDPVKMVRAGTAQFGVASSDRILRENESGAGLVVLAAACYRSPVVFLTKPSQKVTSPADFRGRTIGIQSGTNTELVFTTLLDVTEVPRESMKVVESGWGTQNFEAGVIDVQAAFAYDEPVQLEMKNVPFELLSPETYGVRFVGTVYFTSTQLIDENPTLVQAFVTSLVEGWRLALAEPTAAIDKLKARFPGIDAKKELRSLEIGKPYFAGEKGRLLYASLDDWKQMAESLVRLGALKSPTLQHSLDYRFLENALTAKETK